MAYGALTTLEVIQLSILLQGQAVGSPYVAFNCAQLALVILCPSAEECVVTFFTHSPFCARPAACGVTVL